MLKQKNLAAWGLAAAVTAGCGQGGYNESRPLDYMPDMRYTENRKAQAADPFAPSGAADRVPPEGTVPVGYQPYRYAKEDVERAEAELVNPLPRTKAVLERGQKMFNTYCMVCHGPKGEGDGTVVPKYPRPPSLLSDKIRNAKDGRIYHVITMGQNGMFSYAQQVLSEDRWAIAHYIRALQRADRPDKTGVQAGYVGKGNQ